MPTAILIDGAYFIKRFRAIEPHNAYNPQRVADTVLGWSLKHLSPPKKPKQNSSQNRHLLHRELYRIFFYDCPPLEKKMHNPISKKSMDFSKSDEAKFRKALHQELLKKRKLALRLGHLASKTLWTIRQDVIERLLRGEFNSADLTASDVKLDLRQKGVDMWIGVDVASLAFKKQVDQIVLFAGDADFVPAAKLARREGIDFILDPMWRSIPQGLNEHIDALRSVCPKPSDKKVAC